MKFTKRILSSFSVIGLLFLGACSYSSKPQADSSNSQNTPPSDAISKKEQSTITKGIQTITPKEKMGNSQMTLSVANPVQQGKNTLTLMVVDSEGKPLASKNVLVVTTMSAQEMDAMGMKGMGEGSAKTTVKPSALPGTFEINTDLPFGGTWHLKVDVKDTQPPANAIFDLAVK
jgi:hypothetical protein